jgi:transposase-like protein
MRINLALAVIEQETDERPQQCPRCGARRFHRHLNRRRSVRDTRVERVRVVQYQCAHCQKIVTVYPKGVSRAQQTERLRMLSVTPYALGLSYDKVKAVLQALGAKLCKSWIWHNVQQPGEQAVRAMRKQQGRRNKVTVLGADETQMKVRGEGITVGFVTDPQTGEIVGMEILTGRDSQDFVKWLKAYAQRHGAKVVVSDDLDSYRPAADEMGLEQQICLAHMRKSVSRRLRKIEGYEEDKELIRTAIKALTPQAKRCLKRIQRRYSNHSPPGKGERDSAGYNIRMLTLDILEKWNRLTLYQRGHAEKDAFARRRGPVAAVPATNNATENAIGRGGKIRYRMMRGFKAIDWMLKTTAVVAALGGVLAGATYRGLFG